MNYSHFRNTNEGLIDRFIRVSKGCLGHRMEAKKPSIETSLRNWELLSLLATRHSDGVSSSSLPDIFSQLS